MTEKEKIKKIKKQNDAIFFAKLNEKIAGELKAKKADTPSNPFYNLRPILGAKGTTVKGNFEKDWYRFFILIGSRGKGKSFSVNYHALKKKMDEVLHGKEPVKLTIMFKSDQSMMTALANNCKSLLDPIHHRKFITANGFVLKRNGETVYLGKPDEVEEDEETGKTKVIKNRERIELLRCVALSNMAADKELISFDNEFNGTYIFMLHEFAREKSERKTFDLTYNFVNTIINNLRFYKGKMEIFLCGNMLEEASDVMTLFNFIPLKYGRYFLKKRRAIVDYMAPSEKYKEMLKGSIMESFEGTFEASTFTNEIKSDMKSIHKGRLLKPNYIIQFDRDTKFTVWDKGVIADWKKENKQIIAMRPYQDLVYQRDTVETIVQTFHAKGYKFTNLKTLKVFKQEIANLKGSRG